ncbi:unnamed protein product [Phytophthora fragariaefolia]|uniref:Unnamed protein product n=1 Tax=Phytophthora fragariaefolia TaxID=1490495 RepID=A0A9W7D5P2_9STRA|nr:unnamed protein product [Phytophthora fragariaefolia]
MAILEISSGGPSLDINPPTSLPIAQTDMLVNSISSSPVATPVSPPPPDSTTLSPILSTHHGQSLTTMLKLSAF